jgi:hypothetical protein
MELRKVNFADLRGEDNSTKLLVLSAFESINSSCLISREHFQCCSRKFYKYPNKTCVMLDPSSFGAPNIWFSIYCIIADYLKSILYSHNLVNLRVCIAAWKSIVKDSMSNQCFIIVKCKVKIYWWSVTFLYSLTCCWLYMLSWLSYILLTLYPRWSSRDIPELS